MIRLELSIRNNRLKQIIIAGHAPDSFGKKGENLLCAAVTALTNTLWLYLEKKDALAEKEIQSGYTRLVFKENPMAARGNHQENPELVNTMDMFLTGIENLKKDHPEEIKIDYIEV